MPQMITGSVRGLSQNYADGLERQEIIINKKYATSLPCKDNLRIPIKLLIATQTYDAGIRTTPNVKFVWICPDLRDINNRKISLARILKNNGFSNNQKIILEVDRKEVQISRAEPNKI